MSAPAVPDDEDPRLRDEFVRTVPASASGGTVTLVGVVHDHPASTYRVERVLESTAPDTVALELPPLAVPLFEEYAASEQSPLRQASEMSAAIRESETDDVVGIDGPSLGFTGRLARAVVAGRHGRHTLTAVVRSLVTVTRQAVAYTLAAWLTRRTRLSVAVGGAVPHEVSSADAPAAQARDERRQVRRAETVMNAVESAPASNLRESTRESHMAARLASLRTSGSVVAVVGVAHLDPISERVEAAAEKSEKD